MEKDVLKHMCVRWCHWHGIRGRDHTQETCNIWYFWVIMVNSVCPLRNQCQYYINTHTHTYVCTRYPHIFERERKKRKKTNEILCDFIVILFLCWIVAQLSFYFIVALLPLPSLSNQILGHKTVSYSVFTKYSHIFL